MNLFARWLQFWNRREDATSLALVRIGVALVLTWDLVDVLRLGLVEPLWAPEAQGGIGAASAWEPVAYFYRWFGVTTSSTWLLFTLALGAAVSLGLGVLGRTSALVLLLAYADLERLLPDGDRGIDTLLRNVLAILVFARADATLSLAARLRHGRFCPEVSVPAFPRYLIIAQLTLLYFFAGALKQAPGWSYNGGYPALFAILQKPHVTRFEFPYEVLTELYPVLQAGTFATVVWERAAIALPLLLYLRGTAARGGWFRTWVNRLRVLELWVATGVLFHLSLAAVLALGIFPWGCLALYPAMASPALWARFRVRARLPWLTPRAARGPALLYDPPQLR